MKKNVLLILSTIGILISAYLLYAKLTDNPLICGGSHGCDAVQKSRYSTLLGMPLGFWGMGYYFTLFVAFYITTTRKINIFRIFMLVWGLLFSLYLTYLEAFVIKAYCLWCLGSFATIILITLTYFLLEENRSLEVTVIEEEIQMEL